MRLFKIKNSGLRLVAGAVVVLIVIAVVTFAFWVIGRGVALVDNKFFFNQMEQGFVRTYGATLGVIALGFVSVTMGCLAVGVGYGFFVVSKVLGNKLFNPIEIS